ncbi:CarD family transcriptional regulator [Leptospira interrogans]
MPQKKKVVVPAKGAKAAAKPVAAKPSPKTSGTSAKLMKDKTSSISAKAGKNKVKAAATAVKNAAKTAVKAPVKKAAPAAKPAAATIAPKPAAKVAPAIAAKPPVAAPTPAPARAAAMAKPAQPKISAPAPVTPKDIAARAVEARHGAQAAKKPVSTRHGFKTNEYIVYPAHGVGQIVGIEEQEIAGMSLELFVITFEKDKMTLRVPTGKLESVGMRKLAEDEIVKKAMETLKGRARVKRTMWSRRAQEYEAKINSGDLVSIAEVVRDLYRSETQPEQSYSERQLYEAALDRMAREIAAVDRLDERGAVQKITEVLSKSARGRRAAAEADTDSDDDAVDADAQAA